MGRAAVRQKDIQRAVKAMLGARITPAVRLLCDGSALVFPVTDIDGAMLDDARMPPVKDDEAAAWEEATK